MVATDYIFLVLALKCLLFALNASAQADIPESESYTISSAPGYNLLRTCGLCCLGTVQFECFFANSYLTNAIGCTANSCLCSRADVSTLALNYISTCVKEACSNSGDISEYQTVFGNYCSGYLGRDAPVSSEGSITASGPSGGNTVTVTSAAPASTVTRTATATERTTIVQTIKSVVSVITVASTLADGSVTSFTSTTTMLVATVTVQAPSGLKSSDKVGLGVGLGIGIPLLAAVLVFGCILVRRPSAPRPPIVGGAQMEQETSGVYNGRFESRAQENNFQPGH
ncbi:hypothetical protein ABW20_dc0106695 [Dactylellina cionopaga]|nr:hypothetical protein ABW20_dc0106695 [Dactylellina cionopaga]